MASRLVRSFPDRVLRVQALAGDTVLCSWAKHFSTQEYKWVPANCWGNLANCGEVTCDGLAFRPGGVEILPAASCYRNRDKLRQPWASLAPRLHFFLRHIVHATARSVVYRVQFSSILTSHFLTRVNFERIFIGNIMAATVKQVFKTFVGPFMLLKSIFVRIGRKTNCPLTLYLPIDCDYLFQLTSGWSVFVVKWSWWNIQDIYWISGWVTSTMLLYISTKKYLVNHPKKD